MSKNKGKKISKSSSEGYGHSSSGFISFSDVSSSATPSSTVSKSFNTVPSTSSSCDDVILHPVYRGSDAELAVSCKRMVKKDITTKLKSFNEVTSLLEKNSSLIQEFLPYFVHIIPRILLDNDRKIREQLFSVLLLIVSLNKHSLTPYMKHLIGYWYIGMYTCTYICCTYMHSYIYT